MSAPGGSAPLTPGAVSMSPTQASEAAPGSDLVESFADLALRLPSPHGWEHRCLVCSDARKALGMEPIEPDYWELFGVRWLA